jgi:hypothetical protein
MPIRRILVDLELAALADPGASGDVLLVITPDGVLKRQEIPPPMSTLTYGPGTYDLMVPPGQPTRLPEGPAGVPTATVIPLPTNKALAPQSTRPSDSAGPRHIGQRRYANVDKDTPLDDDEETG